MSENVIPCGSLFLTHNTHRSRICGGPYVKRVEDFSNEIRETGHNKRRDGGGGVGNLVLI